MENIRKVRLKRKINQENKQKTNKTRIKQYQKK